MTFRKRFGQHFLQERAVLNQIISAINATENDHLVEIGAGFGVLTKKIIDRSKRLDLIELDRDLVCKLRKNFESRENCFIHQEDALSFDFKKNFQGRLMRIFGNLPYNISTPFLFHLLNYEKYIQDMHFMLQLEVAERLSAKPRSKSYGRLTVMMQYYWQIELLFSVAKEAFNPPPKVQSAFVRFIKKKVNYRAENLKIFNRVVSEAFNQRRKMIQNSLKKIVGRKNLLFLNIDPKARAEELSLADFVKISNFLC